MSLSGQLQQPTVAGGSEGETESAAGLPPEESATRRVESGNCAGSAQRGVCLTAVGGAVLFHRHQCRGNGGIGIFFLA